MSSPTKSRRGFFGQAFALFGAAASAAAAVDTHRRPSDRDLRTLGIDPKDFTARF